MVLEKSAASVANKHNSHFNIFSKLLKLHSNIIVGNSLFPIFREKNAEKIQKLVTTITSILEEILKGSIY